MYPENPFHVWFILVYRYSPSTSEYFREKALCGQKIYLCQAVVTCFMKGRSVVSWYRDISRCIFVYVGMLVNLIFSVVRGRDVFFLNPWGFCHSWLLQIPWTTDSWPERMRNGMGAFGSLLVRASHLYDRFQKWERMWSASPCQKKLHEGSWWSIHLNYLIHNSIMPNCQVSALHTGRPNKLNTAEAMAAAPRKFRSC